MTMNDTMGFLNSGSTSGLPGVKWMKVGDEVRGTIISEPRVVETQSLKAGGGMEAKLVLEVRTEVDTRITDSTNDDGFRIVNGEDVAVWVRKGWMAGAVRDAVRAAEATSIEEGGKLSLKLVELRKPTTPGYSPTQIFEAKYKAPEKPAGVSLDDL
jgi:hypothetical protein